MIASVQAFLRRLPREHIMLGFILGLAAVLRLGALGRWSLWLDEVYSWRFAGGPVSAIWQQVGEPQPPLYYLLLHYWMALGQSEFWLRLPSALTGCFAVLLMWKTGAAFGNRQVGLLAAALLALSPLHIWYSREARMYGPAACWGLASFYCHLQVFKRDKWRDVIALAAMTLLAIYTAYSAGAVWLLEVMLSLPLWSATGRAPRRLLRWLVAQTLIGLGFLPYWPYFQRQIRTGAYPGEQVVIWLARLGFEANFDNFRHWAFAFGVGMLALLIVFLFDVPRDLKYWGTGPIVGGVFLFGLLTLAGAVSRGLAIRRQLLALWPLGVLLAAWAIIHLRRRWATATFIILSGLLAVFTVGRPAYENWRGAVTFVSQNAQTIDSVLLYPSYLVPSFEYYYHGLAPYHGLPPDWEQSAPNALLTPSTRTWLVLSHDEFVDPTGQLRAWFVAHGQLLAAHAFAGIEVLEYESK